MTELTAALAESRARGSELEAQLLAGLRDRLELREHVQQLTSLLKAEQELSALIRGSVEARSREIQTIRTELVALAQRSLGSRTRRKATAKATNPVARSNAATRKSSPRAASPAKAKTFSRTSKARRGRR